MLVKIRKDAFYTNKIYKLKKTPSEFYLLHKKSCLCNYSIVWKLP